MDQRFHTIRRRFQLDKAVMSVRMKKWAGIIQEAAASGLTKSEFCARNGIDRRQFFHWQKQLREFALQQNPELAMIEVPDGPRQLVRAVNAQLTTSLPVFCELKPPDELPAVPERKEGTVPPCAAEAMIQYERYQIYVSSTVCERTLTTILSVIRHA